MDCFGSGTKLAMTIFVGILVVVCAVLFGVYFYGFRVKPGMTGLDSVMVTRVVDGDTVVVGENKLRLIGIDSPELETEKLKGECFAMEAKERLRELVEGKEIRLEKDVSEKDKYDRLLRYVYIGEENINETLVREGFAKLATYPPDMKYYGKLKEAQRVAKENRAGLWSYCMDSPAETRGINSSSPE